MQWLFRLGRGPPAASQIINDTIAVIVNSVWQFFRLGMHRKHSVVAICPAGYAVAVVATDNAVSVLIAVHAKSCIITILVHPVSNFCCTWIARSIGIIAIGTPAGNAGDAITIRVLTDGWRRLVRLRFSRAGAHGGSGLAWRGHANDRLGQQWLALRAPILMAS